eukprot:5912916-Amphidinium_carterae.3
MASSRSCLSTFNLAHNPHHHYRLVVVLTGCVCVGATEADVGLSTRSKVLFHTAATMPCDAWFG